ncbi:chitobiosyldiphosphodolichol beta-mannosyltransferase [Ascosphaera apis ARSEF 7405]|uniref:Chitobiosyldiphosphodolichol beta-mannosyltransferase n=1 Tax=Ascosphaera apis ARSEF 7405 TaxID=392613 RepID=A0A168BD23_9EURO|nr:chitobiosyldiphosphodolichol beta-mannosyltransferase [Ascosphaera apis ARSEF 7405]
MIGEEAQPTWNHILVYTTPATNALTMSRQQFLASYGLLCLPGIIIATIFFFRQYFRHLSRVRVAQRKSERYAILSLKGLSPQPDDEANAKKAMIVVLGDIGHSPRMQNHALSLAKMKTKVYMVGYLDSEPQDEILYNPYVELVVMPSPPRFLAIFNSKLLYPIAAVIKITHQIIAMWSAMRYECPKCDFMIVQNPPSLPTLLISRIVCWATETRMVIDWHNFGFTILALKLGPAHPLVRLMKYLETRLCHLADSHFCVSRAMALALRRDLQIDKPIHVLYDRPAQIFQPVTDSADRFAFLSSQAETTQYVQKIMDGRCALLVSSTSWTPDENFDILIDALVSYSTLATRERDDLPFLGVIITGKGPLRQSYLDKIAALSAEGKLDRVTVKSTWLPFEDYAKVLACATVGISLPVLGWNDYASWRELVTEGVDGLGFNSGAALSDIFVRLFEGVGETEELAKLKEGAKRQSLRRWDEEWEKVAAPALGYEMKDVNKMPLEDEMQQEN